MHTSKVTFPLAVPLPRLACRAPLTAPVQKQREFRVGLVAVFSTPGGRSGQQPQVTGSVITTEHPSLKGASITTVFYMEMYVVLALLRSNMSIAHCAAGFSEPAVGMTWLINCD